MISPLTITSLDQGKLYGDKPSLDVLEREAGVIHEDGVTEPIRKVRALFPLDRLAWRILLASAVGVFSRTN